MLKTYVDKPTRSLAEVSIAKGEGLIHRINVPHPHRGKGIGSRLLKEICEDADRDGVTLVLYAYASGGLPMEQLVMWYERNGFELKKFMRMERRPVAVQG